MNQVIKISVYEVVLSKNLGKAYLRMFDNEDLGVMIELVGYGSIEIEKVKDLFPIAPPIQMLGGPKRKGWKKISSYFDERPSPMYKKFIANLHEVKSAGDESWSLTTGINSHTVSLPLKMMKHLPLNSFFSSDGTILLITLYVILKNKQSPYEFYSEQDLLDNFWISIFCDVASLFYNCYEIDKAFWYSPLPESSG